MNSRMMNAAVYGNPYGPNAPKMPWPYANPKPYTMGVSEIRVSLFGGS